MEPVATVSADDDIELTPNTCTWRKNTGSSESIPDSGLSRTLPDPARPPTPPNPTPPLWSPEWEVPEEPLTPDQQFLPAQEGPPLAPGFEGSLANYLSSQETQLPDQEGHVDLGLEGPGVGEVLTREEQVLSQDSEAGESPFELVEKSPIPTVDLGEHPPTAPPIDWEENPRIEFAQHSTVSPMDLEQTPTAPPFDLESPPTELSPPRAPPFAPQAPPFDLESPPMELSPPTPPPFDPDEGPPCRLTSPTQGLPSPPKDSPLDDAGWDTETGSGRDGTGSDLPVDLSDVILQRARRDNDDNAAQLTRETGSGRDDTGSDLIPGRMRRDGATRPPGRDLSSNPPLNAAFSLDSQGE